MITPESVDVSGHHRAAGRGPDDGSALEPADPAVGRATDVADGVAETAGLPAQRRPQVPDLAVHLVRAEIGPPVDGAALEVVEPALARAARRLVADRVAQHAA